MLDVASGSAAATDGAALAEVDLSGGWSVVEGDDDHLVVEVHRVEGVISLDQLIEAAELRAEDR